MRSRTVPVPPPRGERFCRSTREMIAAPQRFFRLKVRFESPVVAASAPPSLLAWRWLLRCLDRGRGRCGCVDLGRAVPVRNLLRKTCRGGGQGHLPAAAAAGSRGSARPTARSRFQPPPAPPSTTAPGAAPPWRCGWFSFPRPRRPSPAPAAPAWQPRQPGQRGLPRGGRRGAALAPLRKPGFSLRFAPDARLGKPDHPPEEQRQSQHRQGGNHPKRRAAAGHEIKERGKGHRSLRQWPGFSGSDCSAPRSKRSA